MGSPRCRAPTRRENQMALWPGMNDPYQPMAMVGGLNDQILPSMMGPQQAIVPPWPRSNDPMNSCGGYSGSTGGFGGVAPETARLGKVPSEYGVRCTRKLCFAHTATVSPISHKHTPSFDVLILFPCPSTPPPHHKPSFSAASRHLLGGSLTSSYCPDMPPRTVP